MHEAGRGAGEDRPDLARRWYVVATSLGKEMRAARAIEDLGFPVCLPLERVAVRIGRKSQVIERPLFRSYVFVAFDVAREAWSYINNANCAKRVIAERDDVYRPLAVPAGIVEAFQALGVVDRRPGLVPSVQPGDLVDIEAGNCAKLIGRVLSVDARHRAVILLSLLGAERRVSVDLASTHRVTGRAKISAASNSPVQGEVRRRGDLQTSGPSRPKPIR
jgi:transcription antitermination factor NusG